MAYVLFVVGIILIIWSIKGENKAPRTTKMESQNTANTVTFDNILEKSDILERLATIEEKLSDVIQDDEGTHIVDEDEAEPEDTKEQVIKDEAQELKEHNLDLNKKIQLMKSQGMDIGDIADMLGTTKGEVLLRLGITK